MDNPLRSGHDDMLGVRVICPSNNVDVTLRLPVGIDLQPNFDDGLGLNYGMCVLSTRCPFNELNSLRVAEVVDTKCGQLDPPR